MANNVKIAALEKQNLENNDDFKLVLQDLKNKQPEELLKEATKLIGDLPGL